MQIEGNYVRKRKKEWHHHHHNHVYVNIFDR